MSDGENVTDAVPSPPRTKKNYSKQDDTRKTKVLESDDEEEQKEKIKDYSPPPLNHAVIHAVHVTNSTGVHIGNIYNYGKAKDLGPPVIETEKIKSLKNSTKPVDEKDINEIANHMVKGWKNTFRTLGYKEGQIYGSEYRHVRDKKEIVYDLLKDWIQDKGPKKATVGVLTQALWETEQRIAVKEWSDRYDQLHKK